MRSFKNSTNPQREALYRLANELDNTSVISDEFKSVIWGWTTSAMMDAFERGIEEGKKRARSEEFVRMPDEPKES